MTDHVIFYSIKELTSLVLNFRSGITFCISLFSLIATPAGYVLPFFLLFFSVQESERIFVMFFSE